MKVVCFDLDDTLYKEIDYLHEAYMLIAHKLWGIEWNSAYLQMLDWYLCGQNVFAKICEIKPDVSVESLLHIYRYSVHKLTTSLEVYQTLDELKGDSQIRLGLITDGRSVTQQNKIKALGLVKYFDEADILISEEFGSEKPDRANYEYFMKRYPVASFTYVADNPKKDFVGANTLGWDTVCLLDDGRNIHKQEFNNLGLPFLPKKKIKSITELVDLLKE